ncbi:hypothetical protein F5Y14DRAFT_437218 [Nemania sp. NC0429]|nr:hypothetical protein F5Y14DRAFT_437218 [Nemania sp. NC0429]
MPFLSTPLTLSATGSILGSAWISGGIGALSISTIPALLRSNAPTDGLVRAWYTQFSRSLYIPTTGVIAALNYFYLAHRHRSRGREWRGYAGAGVANLLLLPFTLIFIVGINNTLMASSKHSLLNFIAYKPFPLRRLQSLSRICIPSLTS